MSYFIDTILKNRGIARHDGRPIWQYEIEDEEINELRKSLRKSSYVEAINPKDAAVYFALWWQSIYDGETKPSKEAVYNSLWDGIQPQRFTWAEFFDRAKRGLKELNFKLVKGDYNNLYFRSMLVQGGVPERMLLSSDKQGVYLAFIRKLSKIYPSKVSTVAEIKEEEFIKELPRSSQNDSFIEAFMNLIDSQPDLRQVKNNKRKELFQMMLNVHLDEASKHTKAYWELPKNGDRIKLSFEVRTMSEIQIKSLMRTNSDIGNDLRIFVDESTNKNPLAFYLHARASKVFFPKKGNDIYWNGSDVFPEITLFDNDKEVSYDISYLITYLPDLTVPSLWVQFDGESNYQLIKGNKCPEKFTRAIVLIPDGYVAEGIDVELLDERKVNNNNLRSYSLPADFKELKLTKSNEAPHVFVTGKLPFDWTVISEKPNWMAKANAWVVKRGAKLKVVVYNEDGEVISTNNRSVKWTHYNRTDWRLEDIIPNELGFIKIRVYYDGAEDFGFAFCADEGMLQFSESTAESVIIKKLTSVSFKIVDNDLLKIDDTNHNEIRLSKVMPNQFPNKIFGKLNIGDQKRSLNFELINPFIGIFICDTTGKLLDANSHISAADVGDFIVYINKESVNLVFYNSEFDYIKKVVEYNLVGNKKENSFNLRRFSELIDHLFLLSDTMKPDSRVRFEIHRINQEKPVSVYNINIDRYKWRINREINDDSISLNVTDLNKNKVEDEFELIAVPLSKNLHELNEVELVPDTGDYFFPTYGPSEGSFVVFANDTPFVKPNFVDLDPKYEYAKDHSKHKANQDSRLNDYKEEYISNHFLNKNWAIALDYLRICQQNSLSLSTFEQIMAWRTSSEVASRAFVYLALEYGDEFFDLISQLENDLGFSFLWVSKKHWELAINGIIEAYGDYTEFVVRRIGEYLTQIEGSGRLGKYIVQSSTTKQPNFHFNELIRDLRTQLGEAAIQELPTISNSCNLKFNVEQTIPYKIKTLANTPIWIADAISNRNLAIWDIPNAEQRKIKYCQEHPKVKIYFNKVLLNHL